LLLAAAMVLMLPACAGGFGSYFAPTAAVVGGAKITEEAVVTQLKVVASQTEFSALFKGPQSNLNRVDAKRQILSQLVQQQAVVNEATRLGVSVKDADVQAALATTRQRLGGAAALKTALAQQGLNIDEFTRYERLNLIVTRAQAKVINGINATPDQIAASYQQNKATYDAEYHVAHILICSHADAQGACTPSAADLELAKSVDERAIAGNDFAQLARQYSTDTGSKAAGGDLGWVQPGSAVAPFEQAALALQPGQVTPQPVQSQFGYHIIKLIAKGRPLADAAATINNQLEQTPRQHAFTTWVHQAVARNRIRINPLFGQFDAASQLVVAPPGTQPAPSPTAPAGSSGP
jgi:parvulin-like peptidyl-prolyl isomerase